jgi:pimeloyl-ACP methyl ester carboxylesterase
MTLYIQESGLATAPTVVFLHGGGGAGWMWQPQYEVVHTRKMSLAEEHNRNLTAPDLFTQTVRAWITGQPLPTALQPLRS